MQHVRVRYRQQGEGREWGSGRRVVNILSTSEHMTFKASISYVRLRLPISYVRLRLSIYYVRRRLFKQLRDREHQGQVTDL